LKVAWRSLSVNLPLELVTNGNMPHELGKQILLSGEKLACSASLDAIEEAAKNSLESLKGKRDKSGSARAPAHSFVWMFISTYETITQRPAAATESGPFGMAVIPPSIRRAGDHAGKPYSIIEGKWEDVARLPSIRGLSDRSDVSPDKRIQKGSRNNKLFVHLIPHADHCDTVDDLIDVAQTFSMNCDPPMPDAEVMRTAKSVWGYLERGELWHRGDEQRIVLGERENYLFVQNLDAFALYHTLRMAHGARSEPFAVVCKAMGAARVIPTFGVDPRRYKAALKYLLSVGFLRLVHQGGRRKGDPSLYTFIPKQGEGVFSYIGRQICPPKN